MSAQPITGGLWSPVPCVALRLPGADGPGNLLAAIQAATSPDLTGFGCVIVIADEIHTAKHVLKMDSTSISAFGSPDTVPLAG